jgi:predicted alpha/beta hydrolase family esterase
MELLLLVYPGLPLLSSALTYFIFWYEAMHSGYYRQLREMSGGKLWLWTLIGLSTAVSSQGAVLPLYLAKPFRRFWLGRSKGPGPPVILVHGLYHNDTAWALFAPRLRKTGLGDLHVLNYNSYSARYEEIVERVEAKVREVLESRPAGTKAALVGHSLGGLAVRGWLSQGRSADRALCAVSLGAPHQGSKVAALGIGSLARSLAYQGELIREIERREKPPPCPALSVYTPMDNMVAPGDALRIEAQGWQELRIGPVSHVAMLYSPEASEVTASFVLECSRSSSR